MLASRDAKPVEGVSPETLVMTDHALDRARFLPPATGTPREGSDSLLPSTQPPAVHGRRTRGEGVRLRTESGMELTVACGQRLGYLDPTGNLVPQQAGRLKRGDIVLVNRGRAREAWYRHPMIEMVPAPAVPNGTHPALPSHFDEDLARLAGLYVGNGNIQGNKAIFIAICDQDPDVIAWVIDYLRRRGMRPCVSRKSNCTVVSAHCTQAALWLKANDCHKEATADTESGSASAHVPEAILRSPAYVVVAFLAGYWAADGSALRCKTGTVTVSCSSASKRLTHEVAIILRHLGIRVKVRRYAPSSPKGKLPIYELRIADVHNARLFAERVGILAQRKQQEILDARMPEDKYATRHHSIAHQGLLDDFFEHSEGLPATVRADIAQRKSKGFFNVEWLMRLVEAYPQLRASKAAQLFLVEGLDYETIESVEPVPDQEWVALETPIGEPVIADAFVVATDQGSLPP